jgi:inosine/xanthosine triphosphatase
MNRVLVVGTAAGVAAAAWVLYRIRRRHYATTYAAVVVGSLNQCKLEAVRNVVRTYPRLAREQDVQGVSVPSGVSEQPLTLEETTRGARSRAQAAFAAYYSSDAACCSSNATCSRPSLVALGIESGLFAMEGTYFDVCVVSAYDGREHHLGLSCAFQIPPRILSNVLDHGMDLSQASNAAGITKDPKLGEHQGLIGILSHGRLSRLAYTETAVHTALLWAENARWYPSGGKCGVAPSGPGGDGTVPE